MNCFFLLVFSNMFLEIFLLFFIHCEHLFFISCFFFCFFLFFFLFHNLLNLFQLFLINISYSRFSMFSCVFSFRNSIFSCTNVWLVVIVWWMLLSATSKWRFGVWIIITFVWFWIFNPQTSFFFVFSFFYLMFCDVFLEINLLFFVHCEHLFFICCFFFSFFFLFFFFHKLLNLF
jgi:hypothetical protein